MAKKRMSVKERMAQKRKKDEKKGNQFGYLDLPSDVKVLKIGDAGKYKMDFIPYLITSKHHMDADLDLAPGDSWYRCGFKIHRNIGPSDDVVVCPTSFGKRCPICEYRAKRAKEGADYEELKTMNASQRFLYAVIPIDWKDEEEEIHILDYSKALLEDAMNEAIELEEIPDDFWDPADGCTLNVIFREEKLGKNKFYEVSRMKEIEREEAYDENIAEEAPRLDECLKVLPYDQLESLFFELEDPDEKDDPEEVDEKPKSDRKPKSGKKKKDKEEVEEVEEKPKRSKKPKKDDEEKPKKDSKKGKSKKSSKDECPEGHKFAVDFEEYDACDDCPLWDRCMDANSEL